MDFNHKHKGCLSEQKAKVWFLEQGYEVFENISAHGEVDLIILDPSTNETTLIDVTTGRYYLREDGNRTLYFSTGKLKKRDSIKVLVFIPETNEFIFVKE